MKRKNCRNLQNSKTKPQLRPDWDPPTPYLIKNSWKNCMKRGSGRVVTTEAPGNAHFLPTEKGTLRREGDPETGLLFIFRYLWSIRRDIGLLNAAKYGRSSPM
jgi:hypothetical protein